MLGHARCAATVNEINMISMFNINLKAKKSECFGMVQEAKATTPCQSNSRAPQRVRVPMKTQQLELMALTVYSESVPALSIEGGNRVLKTRSNHCFHLFTVLLQDNNISSKAIKSKMITDAVVLQLTKNSKIFGKRQLY